MLLSYGLGSSPYNLFTVVLIHCWMSMLTQLSVILGACCLYLVTDRSLFPTLIVDNSSFEERQGCKYATFYSYIFSLSSWPRCFSQSWGRLQWVQENLQKMIFFFFFFFPLSESRKWQKCPKKSDNRISESATPQEFEALLEHLFPVTHEVDWSKLWENSYISLAVRI